LWNAFESGYRPFEGAVLLGDAAYPCRDWLIPPLPTEQEQVQQRFNKAHRQTRNLIERVFGVLKKRFYALKTGFRVRNMEFAGKLVICAVVLHNLCILHGDKGEDLTDFSGCEQPPHDPPVTGEARDRRRQQILNFFM
jgi:hypothetical protein